MSENKIVWIRCEISEGMFSQEFNVQIVLPNGQTISFFADRNLIQTKAGRNYVRATLIGDEDNIAKDNKTVLLPVEPFETGTRWISIPENEFAPA